MPEPIVGEAPKVDAFGEPVKPVEGEGKKDEGGEKGEGGKKGDGEKLTPTQQVAELSRQLGEYQNKEKTWGETDASKTENIRNMAAKIDALTKQAGSGKGAGEGDADVRFKDIKFSKDLTAEEKEEMTDSEIKMTDMIATLQQSLNTIEAKIKKSGETKKEGGDVVDIQGIVKNTAKELASGNKELANQIIESAKQFSMQGLTEEQVVERVASAAKLVSDYKPPKENVSKGGKAAGGGTDADPYGIDKIVDEVATRKENKGFNL